MAKLHIKQCITLFCSPAELEEAAAQLDGGKNPLLASYVELAPIREPEENHSVFRRNGHYILSTSADHLRKLAVRMRDKFQYTPAGGSMVVSSYCCDDDSLELILVIDQQAMK